MGLYFLVSLFYYYIWCRVCDVIFCRRRVPQLEPSWTSSLEKIILDISVTLTYIWFARQMHPFKTYRNGMCLVFKLHSHWKKREFGFRHSQINGVNPHFVAIFFIGGGGGSIPVRCGGKLIYISLYIQSTNKRKAIFDRYICLRNSYTYLLLVKNMGSRNSSNGCLKVRLINWNLIDFQGLNGKFFYFDGR